MTGEAQVGFAAAAGRVAWIDFEASSLNPTSFPTEVGWAVIANGAVVSGGWLIRPLPEWLAIPDAWSAESERLTGISRAMLDREAHPVEEVVGRLTAAVGGRLLLSDNPEFDGHWFNLLFNAAGMQQWAGRSRTPTRSRSRRHGPALVGSIAWSSISPRIEIRRPGTGRNPTPGVRRSAGACWPAWSNSLPEAGAARRTAIRHDRTRLTSAS